MIPWNSEATAQDHLAAARDPLPCEDVPPAREEGVSVTSWEYRWASERGAHSMPHPDELRYLGFLPALRDGQEIRNPRYPGSLLMVRDV